jgi:aspartate ammonia-lyase
VSFAVQAGQLELNVMTPVIMYNVLFSIQLLSNFLPLFGGKCVEGISVDEKRCTNYLEKNPALATFLSLKIGYLEAAKIAKQALEQGRSVKEIALEKGLLTTEELERLLNPKRLLSEKR